MSYQAIARKYRPQTFDEVIGQAASVRTLRNAIENDKVAHAYIFSGTRGVGKTTTARILAKSLNCEKGPTTKPCGLCPACTEIAAATAVDVIEIDAASNRGIDEIRELRESVRYLPARDRNKIFIIDEAHMLTNEAFNALLKTLEEPPPRVVFVLATTEPHKIPATIQSRCQQFHFRTISFQEIIARLEEIARIEGIEIEPEALAILARGAEGSLRDSLSLLDQVLAYSGKKASTETVRELLGVVGHELLDLMVEAIREQSSQKALQLVDELVRDGHNLQHFCREALRHIRNLLLVRVGGEAAALVEAAGQEKDQLTTVAADFAEEDLLRFFNSLLKTEQELRYAPQPRLHLELGLLKLVQAGRLAALEEVLAGLDRSPGAAAAPAHPTSAPASVPAPRPRNSAPVPSAPRREPAPAPAPRPAPMSEPDSSKAKTVVVAADSLPPETVQAIKTAVYDASKFLGSLMDRVVAWRTEDGELHLSFGTEDGTLVGMLSRQQQGQLEEIISKVLDRRTRVHTSVEGPAGRSAAAPSGENGSSSSGPPATHPTVDALVKTFGGRVRPASQLAKPKGKIGGGS